MKDRTLHYKPEKASAIINACVVLHNMCIVHNVPEIDDEFDEGIEMGIFDNQVGAEHDDLNNCNTDLLLGRRQRDRLVQLLQNRI